MLIAAAFCPHPPLLVPAVGSGTDAELRPLRDACRTALRRVARPGRRVVVLGAGATPAAFEPAARGSFAAFGVPAGYGLGAPPSGPVRLPLSLAVAAYLLDDALGAGCGAIGFAVDAAGREPAGVDEAVGGDAATVLIVMGDGSARRSIKAPGYLDERAEGFDRQVADALASGAPDRLRGTARPERDQLLVAGGPAWDVAARLLAGRDWDAELLFDDAPYGVGYFVATWVARG